MIKVLQVVTDTNIGGAGIWLLNYLSNFDANEIDAKVLIPTNSKLKQRIEELNIEYFELESIKDRSFSFEAIAEIRELLRKIKPDIIHTHASLSARVAARMEKISIVNTRHCLEKEKKGIIKPIYRLINNFLSDISVAVSKAVYDNLSKDGITKNKLRLVYNGVKPLQRLDAETINSIKDKYGINNCFTFGIFARLEKEKNHQLFLSAAKAAYEVNNNFRFLIVGTGSMEENLKNIVKMNNMQDYVIFTGHVDDVTGLMNAVDVNVLTSDYEALSISLIEGMTLSKPCITTDAGGTKEVVEHNKSGYVVPVNNAVNLSMCMLKIASDKNLAKSFGEQGKIRADSIFNIDTMCEKLFEIYTELSNRKEDKND